MTAIASLVIALAAGLLLRGPRRTSLAVVPSFLAVLAVQTWLLGSGRGRNPASTITDPGYWIIQVVLLAVALGLAGLISAWRGRRTSVSAAAGSHE